MGFVESDLVFDGSGAEVVEVFGAKFFVEGGGEFSVWEEDFGEFLFLDEVVDNFFVVAVTGDEDDFIKLFFDEGFHDFKDDVGVDISLFLAGGFFLMFFE